jgi:hypothetical protein
MGQVLQPLSLGLDLLLSVVALAVTHWNHASAPALPYIPLVNPLFISCGVLEDAGHLRPALIAQTRAEGLACGGGWRKRVGHII